MRNAMLAILALSAATVATGRQFAGGGVRLPVLLEGRVSAVPRVLLQQ